MAKDFYYDLADGTEADEPFHGSVVPAIKQPWRRSPSWMTIIVLHWMAIGALCLLLLTLHAQFRQVNTEIRDRVYSPAQHMVRHENLVFTSGFGRGRTEYMGEPTPENEAAWSDLYNFGISRIPQSSAAQLINKTVPIPNDPGYYAVGLEVFHQLHCLASGPKGAEPRNMIRKRLYMTEEIDREDELMGMDHIEHCVDELRQSLMCSSDITPLTWTWVEKDQKAKEVADVIRTCRSFDSIRRWALDNRIKHFDTHVYVHDDLTS